MESNIIKKDNMFFINNSKFKSVYTSLNFLIEVDKDVLANCAVLASIITKSSRNYKNEKEILMYLNSLYGASFGISLEKVGELLNFEIRIECINKNFLPNKEDYLSDSIRFLKEIIFNLNLHNEEFDLDTIRREKQNIIEKISKRKDNKIMYAINRQEEILSPNSLFGMYIYSDEESIKKVNNESLLNTYNKIINESIKLVIMSGNLSGYDNLADTIKGIFSDKICNSIKTFDTKFINENINKIALEETIEESNTNQSLITFGINLKDYSKEDMFIYSIYNVILGGYPLSRLFQIFREQKSLAYTVRSRFYRLNGKIIIYAGIEGNNYESAKSVVLDIINDLKIGNISESDLISAKENIISDLLDWKDSKVALAKMLLANLYLFDDINVDVDYMIQKIKDATLEDIKNIAKKIEVNSIYFLGSGN